MRVSGIVRCIYKSSAHRSSSRSIYLSARSMADGTKDHRPDHLERTAENSRYQNITSSEVQSVEIISPTVKKLTMLIEDSRFSFKAGQWVDFFIPGVETVGGYSMCSSPILLKEQSLLELAVKYSTHPPALWVHTKCNEGSEVNMRAGGDFFLDNDQLQDRNILLIAGGVGINPLYSMMLYMRDCQIQGQNTPPVTLLYSAKTDEELIFKEDIEKVSRDCDNIQSKFFKTGEKSDAGARIQLEDIKDSIKAHDSSKTHCYICGPGPMIDTIEGYLLELSIPKENIHYEKWW